MDEEQNFPDYSYREKPGWVRRQQSLVTFLGEEKNPYCSQNDVARRKKDSTNPYQVLNLSELRPIAEQFSLKQEINKKQNQSISGRIKDEDYTDRSSIKKKYLPSIINRGKSLQKFGTIINRTEAVQVDENKEFDSHIDKVIKVGGTINQFLDIRMILDSIQKEEQKLKVLRKRTKNNNKKIMREEYKNQISEDAMKYFGWTNKNAEMTIVRPKPRLIQLLPHTRRDVNLTQLHQDFTSPMQPQTFRTLSEQRLVHNSHHILNQNESKDSLSFYSPRSIKADESILKTVFIDQKFMKFYETKYRLKQQNLAPFNDSHTKMGA
ncbi:UNKNOWN [Stylonychia lemnae]|uniref:Uncharacterized protein n=1 Tax=Stylonychia lemnae TaxID=5949 RepID=A0A078ACR3_STYLE|nr:UNKNOWN [Stylonychia lemnae]|eukprot:CDW79656.1 UNKNOWN [Stylonychia lemnae]